jgi:hypothetical protein
MKSNFKYIKIHFGNYTLKINFDTVYLNNINRCKWARILAYCLWWGEVKRLHLDTSKIKCGRKSMHAWRGRILSKAGITSYIMGVCI